MCQPAVADLVILGPKANTDMGPSTQTHRHSLTHSGPVYTMTLSGENEKIFYRMCLSFIRRRRFWGLKTQKSETTLQSGNLKNAPPSRYRLKGKNAKV